MARYQRALGRLDAAVAPLAPGDPVNRCRSASKWMERALHGTAMVVQDLDPYACVEDGTTGLKATTEEEWTAQLLRLVDDAALRRRLGEQARDEVLAKHTIEDRAPLWRALVAEGGAGRR